MSKARNERMTSEQQIQPLEGKDIRSFFPAIGLSDISPFRTFVAFVHYAQRGERVRTPRSPPRRAA
jgi:hypothetical protein